MEAAAPLGCTIKLTGGIYVCLCVDDPAAHLKKKVNFKAMSIFEPHTETFKTPRKMHRLVQTFIS